MTFVVRIRLSLADRAGALGQAATVIGLHAGNIVSVDVHSTDGASAVDDLVVEFPSEPSADELTSDLAMTAAATIVEMQEAQPVDLVTAVLDALQPGVGTGTRSGTDPVETVKVGAELIDGLAVVCPSTEWSLVERAPEEPEGPVVADSDKSKLQLVIPTPGSAWAIVARRPASVPFTATERARIDAVIRLWVSTRAAATR